MAAVTIRQKAIECRNQFRLLAKIEDEVQELDKAESHNDADEGVRTQDQLARFEMWAGNIGVFAESHASLDYRVRTSNDARQLMVEFLSTLLLALSTATEAIRPIQALSLRSVASVAGDSFDPSASSAISSAFQGTEAESTFQESPEAANPSMERLGQIERAIDRLYRLSKHIRRPTALRQNPKADIFPITDDDGRIIDKEFTDFALEIVTHRFPDVLDGLRKRLANGIVVRRKRFLYRRNHQRKLSTTTMVHLGNEREEQVENDRMYEAESTVKGGPRILFESPVQEVGGFEGKLGLQLALSQTSASGMAQTSIPREKVVEGDEESNVSTTFTNTAANSNPILVPRPPKPAPGSKEFECPYCCTILPITHAKASRWRRHVLQDIEPYTCTFERCPDHHVFFAEKGQWVSHMRKAHTSRWLCTSLEHSSSFYCNTEKEYEEHMRKYHIGTFTEGQLQLLTSRSKVPVSALFVECPLCGWKPGEEELKTHISTLGWDEIPPDEVERVASDRITKHLANHLEALNVKSLPWQDVPDETQSEKSESQRAQEGTDASDQESSMVHRTTSILSLLSLEQDGTVSPTWQADYEPGNDTAPGWSYEEEWGFISRPPYYGHDRDPILQTLLRKLYLDASTFTGNTRGPKLPAYLVPLDPGKNFYSRGYALGAIRDALCPTPETEQQNFKPMTFPRCFAIYGPGGIGKTQIAAQFVATNRHRFDAVLWVYAENANKIFQDFKDIAVDLGLIPEDHVDAKDLSFCRDVLKRWLVNPLKRPGGGESSRKEKASWLLVFDGVENGDILNEFWPYDGPGSILITSRNPYSWSASLELKPFSTNEATEYLLHITGRQVTDEERASVVAIAKRLGGLPLALAQMGSIIQHQEISFSEFLRSYEARGGQQELLHRPLEGVRIRPANYEQSVASIWAFDSLASGATLLNILSMLDPDGIPEKLFELDAKEASHPDVEQLKSEYQAAKNELLARSLVTGNKRERKLFVHRLVQDVLRSRMSTSQLRRVFLTCIRLVSSKWPFEQFAWRHGNARWDACEELYPHVQRLKDLFPEIEPSTDSFEDYEFARLLIDAGCNNIAQGICESLKLRILEDPVCVSGDPNILSQINYSLTEINHNRGCIALEVNEPVSALKYHKLFNDMMMKELAGRVSHNDMRLAISWNELGNSYMLNGNWAQGEECFLRSIDEMKKLNHYQPIMISLPLSNIGLAYWLQGKLLEAEAALSQGLRDREKAFGADDRISFITGRFLHALGNVKGSLGRPDEAHDYHRRTLMHYKATLGNRHHRTADVFVKVADHNLHLQQHKMALALLDYALEAYSNSHHYLPEKMRASLKRSRALRGLDRIEDADAELSKCFKTYSSFFDELVRNKMAKEADRKMSEGDLTDKDVVQFIAFWSR
ncbi:hypothetical protein H2200_003420 [Cladophialophora chaetospira]|uniref:NB-ARC domain-containing protein n=1 Tax=Cladophialophora chaetospira TaxID=386627 RepID=A0AA38XHB3_9EURO|nr:hypothetical protein H2200_003420 [Cladophialophora chaetospira]